MFTHSILLNQTVVRIISTVKRFINKLKYKVNLRKETSNKESIHEISSGCTGLQQPSIHDTNKKYPIFLSDKEIKEAQNYFFKKATAEIKKITRETQ